MPILDLVLLFLGGAGALYALASAIGVVRAVRGVPVLAESTAPPPACWPRVSVVIPACNEAADIDGAVRSRLADDYPDLEIVLVDDRSTDGTGEIADRLAREDGRVRPLHVVELPPGWLGKLFALDRGAHAASGELLLFSDADVHVAPGALRRAVALMEAGPLDHLGVLPSLWPRGLLLETAFSAFFRLVWLAARPWSVPDPRSKAAFGVGAFNLVRRGAFERSPGFEHLKLEQADDAALGQMLKRSGARCAVANGRGDLGLLCLATTRSAAQVAGVERCAMRGGLGRLGHRASARTRPARSADWRTGTPPGRAGLRAACLRGRGPLVPVVEATCPTMGVYGGGVCRAHVHETNNRRVLTPDWRP